MDTALPQLGDLIETRLLLLRHLADSLEVSRSALLCNDAEAIARGAAHQAELCRQWSRLEDQLRSASEPRPARARPPRKGRSRRSSKKSLPHWPRAFGI
jgi:hypothetical protein